MTRFLTVASVIVLAALAGGCEREDAAPKQPSHAPAPPRPRPGSGSSSGSATQRPWRSPLVEEGIGSGPARVQTEAEAKAWGEPECPKFVGQQSTAAHLVGRHGRTLPHEDGWAFQFDKGISIFSPTDGKPIQTIPPADIPKGIIAFDDDAWYIPHCQPSGCGEHGTGVVIDRVDRKTKQATPLVGPQSEIVTAQVLGDHLYWTTFGPYGLSGELARIRRTGGKVETLWHGHGVTAMLLEPDTAFVATETMVVVVPLKGGKPRVLADTMKEVRAIAADRDHVYIGEYGDPYWASKPSGYVKRVPRSGGRVEVLAGPVKWPTAVAVDDERVYYMLAESGTVWGLVKGTTDPPTMIVPQPPRDGSCQRSQWLRADATGLIWFRKVEGFGKGNLWRLSRRWLPSPPDTAVAAFRRWMEANPGAWRSGSAGSGSGSAEGSSADSDRDDAP